MTQFIRRIDDDSPIDRLDASARGHGLTRTALILIADSSLLRLNRPSRLAERHLLLEGGMLVAPE